MLPPPQLREQETLTTLIDLGRQVAGVLDVTELLAQIPRLIARLIEFDAFAVYLLDERRGDLRVAYSVGYPQARRADAAEARPGAGRRRRGAARCRCSSTTSPAIRAT